MLLKRLSIANLAIIENLEVIFEEGLNIITGETGAGKSILISSLKLILGHKPDPDMIRTGTDKMIVEAEFFGLGKEQTDILEKNGIEACDSLIVRREVYLSKRSRIFINDTPSNAEVLSMIGDSLIDIHGQHDHQSLLNRETHINILDDFSYISTSEIGRLYNESISLKKEIDRVTKKEKELYDKKELLSYHFKEIKEASPKENEDEEISAELKKLDSVEDLKNLCRAVTETAEGEPGAILRNINIIKNKCESLTETDKNFAPFINDLESSYQAVKEFSSTCELYANSLEFDEEKYDRLSERYLLLKKLMKKFGPELSDVIRYGQEISVQLDSIENIGSDREKLIKQADELDRKIKKECSRLTAERKSAAQQFEKAIKDEFSEVGLNAAVLSVRFSEKAPSQDGADDIEFYIRTNIGEEFKPLSKTASGGEVSRIMLSIKNISASGRESEISVFDEIDSGISGRIAEKVGEKLLKLSMTKQVITITHLPSIASKGVSHYSVRKRTAGQRTIVDVIKLNLDQRTEEIASLITSGKAGDDLKKLAAKLLEG
ncbi:MAG: DNA repair protein RecN [Candidatus Delongbacteria bacterium]|nr:DNA repair protein RecN [Candidatus Delongbacteria bacterium]